MKKKSDRERSPTERPLLTDILSHAKCTHKFAKNGTATTKEQKHAVTNRIHECQENNLFR